MTAECCTGVEQETPEVISNRPALPSVAYRAGRYATFNASMLAALSDPALPALAPLRTRDPGDFSIALLDGWAVVLDILTFYQERFANEAYLGTAVDQRSVFELARLTGYVPSPGVSASAVLAFTLSSAPGSPDPVPVPAGTRVQSIPGPGQTPQVFETSADLTARIAWNALPAQTAIPWQLFGADTDTWITGTANNINVGDGLLFIHVQDQIADFHYVTAVTPDPKSGNTHIWWDSSLADTFATGDDTTQVQLFVFRKKAALYGAQAPSPLVLSSPNITHVPGYPDVATSPIWDFFHDFDNPAGYNPGSFQINLDASYPGLHPTAAAPQWLVLTSPNVGTDSFQISGVAETSPGFYTLTAKTTQLTLSDNAGQTVDGLLAAYVSDTPNVTALVRSDQLTPAPIPLGEPIPVFGSSVTVTGGQTIAAGQPVGVSGKRLRIQAFSTPTDTATFVPATGQGSMTVPVGPAGQIFLITGFSPADGLWNVTTLSGVPGTLSADLLTLLPADDHDPPAGEAAVVQSVVVSGDSTILTLTTPLAGIYDAATVSVNANAVLATNGQTTHEILGSGDATNPALRFTLKQTPLTYLPAPVGNGTQSTLQVWVNNLRWHQTSSLLTAGPSDRVFVTNTDPSGHTVIQFGNGVQGARPPTGTANIRAVYRTGIGGGGMVAAGQLSQPLDRPQGVSQVINPGPASGAADPATADQARASAPLPTLTIGRVVSLEDYQNYALGFAGISMALATWTWFGSIRGVFLTVAGAGGTVFAADDPVITSLATAIRLNGDPHVPLLIASYQPVPFTFGAAVVIDQANYAPAEVLSRVWQNLRAAYAFGRRRLGQPVAASEITEIIQQTAGVTAAQLQGLATSGTGPVVPSPAILCASGPRPPAGAQLLLLDPATQGQIGAWSP